MYRLASVLLAFGVSFGATVFAADETVTVTGSKETPGQSPGLFGGGPGFGGQPSIAGKPCPPDGGVDCGGGGGSGALKFGPTNAQLAEMALTQIGALVTTLRDQQAWAFLEVIVTTPDGLKVEVRLELGYGKVNVVSRKKAA